MKEELHSFCNKMNYFTVLFRASYCTFMMPGYYFLTCYSANLILPILEIG
jgi:hypothetical protein